MKHTHVFLITHLGAGASLLANMLNASHRINVLPVKPAYYQYDDPSKLENIIMPYLHIKPLSTTFIHRINYSHTISNKSILGVGRFIYLIREPLEALNYIVKEKRYTEQIALRYYTFRLRRICEMARLTDGIFFTWDDLVKGTAKSLIIDMLKLKELSFPYKDTKSEHVVHESIIDQAQASYNKHLRYLRQLPLKQ
jgi:hypothetical protein